MFSRPITSLHPPAKPKPVARIPQILPLPKTPARSRPWSCRGCICPEAWTGDGAWPGKGLGRDEASAGFRFAAQIPLGLRWLPGSRGTGEPRSHGRVMGQIWGSLPITPGLRGSGTCLTGTAAKRRTNGSKTQSEAGKMHQPGRARTAEPGQIPSPGRAGAVPTTGTLQPRGGSRSSAHPGPLENGAGNPPRGATGPVRGLHRIAQIITQRSGGRAPGQGTPCPAHHELPGRFSMPRWRQGRREQPRSRRLSAPPPLPELPRSAPGAFSARAEAVGKAARAKENKSKC